MSRLSALKAATSLSDVASLLSFKPKALSYLLYKLPDAKKYKTFQIPKRSGGQRTIMAPTEALRLAQRRLSDLLQDCIDEIDKRGKRRTRPAHGFLRGCSIVTNAMQHRRRRFVFNLDLEDFFPSINFGRVRGFLIKNRDFALHVDVATVVAQLACHQNSLPQGSPSSPAISNLIAHLLDMRLVRLAARTGCSYSRYADDLTFSTNKGAFPPEIGVPASSADASASSWLPGSVLLKEVERAGFRLNPKKTHLMYRNSRQVVTGLVVNAKVNVRAEYRRNVRAMVHRLVRTGEFIVGGTMRKADGASVQQSHGQAKELHGMLGFVDSIANFSRKQKRGKRPLEFSSMDFVYRSFLFYSQFFAASAPVVICEGETDNVYLTHAIRSLASEFPHLAEATQGSKIRLKVRLYKYSDSSTARLLRLGSGGSGVLAGFVNTYEEEVRRFATPAHSHPVVILYDNDDGGRSIEKAIGTATRTRANGTEPFLHVAENLYAVRTPLVGNAKESRIEDFFDSDTRGALISGKAFNGGKGFDPAKHYGKKVFAHRVIGTNADRIDFGGFRPLLRNLSAAIEAHIDATSRKFRTAPSG